LTGLAPPYGLFTTKLGTPNKLSIGRVQAAVAAAAGRGSEFDALAQLRAIAKHFLDRAAAAKPNTKLANDLLDRAARVLRDIVPYQHQKMTGVKVGGDPDAPPLNLSGLSDNELAFLRRTIIKACSYTASSTIGIRAQLQFALRSEETASFPSQHKRTQTHLQP
jgi:hypothetical protein